MMTIDARKYRFVLLDPTLWDKADVKLIETVGRLVPSTSYHDTWSLSRTPGGYRYYAWKRAWRRAGAAVLNKKYLWAENLTDLLRQVQEVTE